MELQVGVKALLRNKEGKFLLLERSPVKYPEVKDRWDIVGGRIDPGTPLLDNLKREIKEETGLELADEPQLVAAQDILKVPGRHVVRLTYIAEIDGEPVLDEDHVGFHWFSLPELGKLENLDEFFKNVLATQLNGPTHDRNL